MALEHRFVCPLPNGVHARPASALEGVARRFASTVSLRNERTGQVADAKSVLSIVGLSILQDDPCAVIVSGADESLGLAELQVFLRDAFPHCDDALPVVPAVAGELVLPPCLREAGVKVLPGLIVVSGIGQGRIVRAGGFQIPATLPLDGVTDIESEQGKLDGALQALSDWYAHRLAAAGPGIEGRLLAVHQSMARDQAFRQQLCSAIAERRRTAAGAIADAAAHFTALLAASGSALLRERALDVQDICIHLLRLIYGRAAGQAESPLTEDAVVVAHALTPGQFLALDRRFLKGLVLTEAGTTSHTVILARSLGIPTLTAVADLGNRQLDGQEAVADADLGALVTQLSDRARRYYLLELRRLASRRARLRSVAAQPGTTHDGHRVEIAVNLAAADEVATAWDEGAESVGLFRTELLFLDRDAAPDEEEQRAAYGRVLAAAGGRPGIIRTLDIGGDKPLSYLNLPAEQNPFLGCRAVRIYPGCEPLFRTQVRALLRASVQGRLQVLVPMIATLTEARWVKRIFAEERARCVADGLSVADAVPLGAMIEVPAAVFGLEALAREMDFFSVGSNDLLQYFMAVDRTNARVARLFNPLEPAFLRLLQQAVEAAHAQGKWIGLCGELAGQVPCLPLLIGLGFDELSAASPVLAALKAALARLALAECRQLLAAALACDTADEVAARLGGFGARRPAPLLAPELVLQDVEAHSKEEAIKQAVDLLHVTGRTEQPRVVEEAVWAREATYSTGFGHGFAIPHCKSAAVQASSLVVLKLRAPVAWGSLDGLPVRVVVLLAMRESDAATGHLKVFARLARQVMHEDFRGRIEQAEEPAALCAFLRESLEA
jgi:multiphosphoryl transfer protein